MLHLTKKRKKKLTTTDKSKKRFKSDLTMYNIPTKKNESNIY